MGVSASPSTTKERNTFIQTQVIYDIDRFERFMEEVRSDHLDEKVHVMGGVPPLKSAKVAKYMKTKVAGIIMPDSVITRMEKAPDPKAEGIKICIETVKHLKAMKGVHGVHVMAIAWEEKVPEIVRRAGLRP